MTLPLNSRLSALYDTNGTQKDFGFGFRVFFDPDNGGYGLEVRRQTADGYEVIPKSDYLVLPIEDNSAGIVRFSVAPSAGQQIYIAGKTPTIQQLVLTNFGRYSAESIETQFDFITAIIQEWLSALDEETRQRIAADEILTQYVVQRIDDFVQQVNQNWDDKSQEIEDYIATIMPSLTQTLREEIEAFAVAGMQDAIDQTLAESKAEIDDAVSRANAAALAAAIAGKVYDTPDAGVDPVSGVPDGAYFNVRSSSDESYVDEYQNVGGSAVATGKSYLSALGVELQEKPASTIMDASGETQQFINDGVESIAQLRTINPKRKGIRLYLNSVIAGKDLGGGMFVSTQKAGLADNGGTVISSPDPLLFWVRVNYDNVIPQFWGALGDKTNDDRPAFQSAVNYLHSIGGGELLVPKPVSGYRWKSYGSVDSACLTIPAPLGGIYVDPITIRGAGNLIDIKVDLGLGVLIDAAIKLKGGGLYKKFENLSVWGGVSSTTPNCTRVLDGFDTWYPNLTIRDCQFYVAVEDCVRLSAYVAVFDKTQTAYSKKGIRIQAPGGVDAPCTALTFNSPYGLNHTHNALWLGQTTYSTINSPAADHIINTSGDGYEAYPYYIDIARGVTINGLGAESSTRILKARSAQGLTINGIMTLSIGNNANPPAYLIRIDGGSSATISGLHFQGAGAYGKILSLGSTFGTESVTIIDDTILPSQVEYVSNFRNERPIRFLWSDTSRKTQDNTLANTGNATTNTANLANLARIGWDTELLHDNIIRFPSGNFEIDGLVSLVNAYTRGSGRVRLIGHADGTSKLIATGAGGLNFGLATSLATINFTVENLELQIGAITGNNKAFNFFKSVTTFTNGKITSDNASRQYYATSDATLRLNATSAILTPVFEGGDVEFTYKATSAPTNSTRLPAGTIFKASDPNATRYAWINTTNNGAVWLAMAP